jgi:hypothetical protein
MTDHELAVYLGISQTPGWENVIRTLTKSQRATYDKMKSTEEDIKLWQEGVGAKPKDVILCHEHKPKRRRRSGSIQEVGGK